MKTKYIHNIHQLILQQKLMYSGQLLNQLVLILNHIDLTESRVDTWQKGLGLEQFFLGIWNSSNPLRRFGKTWILCLTPVWWRLYVRRFHHAPTILHNVLWHHRHLWCKIYYRTCSGICLLQIHFEIRSNKILKWFTFNFDNLN